MEWDSPFAGGSNHLCNLEAPVQIHTQGFVFSVILNIIEQTIKLNLADPYQDSHKPACDNTQPGNGGQNREDLIGDLV